MHCCPLQVSPWLRTSCAALAMLAMPGCWSRAQPTGTVSGQVMYKGKPVPAGCLVTFVAERGVAALGTVDGGGKYQLMLAGKPEVPALNYKVAVTFPGVTGPEMTDEDERKFMAGDAETVAKFSRKGASAPIPKKYSDEFSSGLSFKVDAGPNTFDIELQ